MEIRESYLKHLYSIRSIRKQIIGESFVCAYKRLFNICSIFSYKCCFMPEPFIYDWMEHLQETMKEREQEIISEKLDLIMPYGGKQ